MKAVNFSCDSGLFFARTSIGTLHHPPFFLCRLPPGSSPHPLFDDFLSTSATWVLQFCFRSPCLISSYLLIYVCSHQDYRLESGRWPYPSQLFPRFFFDFVLAFIFFHCLFSPYILDTWPFRVTPCRSASVFFSFIPPLSSQCNQKILTTSPLVEAASPFDFFYFPSITSMPTSLFFFHTPSPQFFFFH